MHLPHALNHRLRQSCRHCPIPHHILYSQTPSAGEKKIEKKSKEVSAMNWCVHAGEAIAGARCMSLPLQKCSIEGCGGTLQDGPPESQLSSPSWHDFTGPLCQYKPSGRPVCRHPFDTQWLEVPQSGYRCAVIQYSLLIHLASTWKDLTTCTIQAPRWDSANRNRPVITK